MNESEKTSRRIPEESAATREEIVAAFEALTRPQLLRLEQFARWRIRGLGRAALGRDWEDLLRQAVADTYEGRRRWNKDSIDFSRHLIGVMRSTSTHWREQFDPGEPFSESEVVRASDAGGASNPMLTAAAPGTDHGRAMESEEEIARIEQLVGEKPLAWLILEGRRDGMSGAEIREALGVSQTDYETAMKWLRRNVRTKNGKEG